ncbi:unnamed protein product [Cladocopium goreaui]|uniref:Uncharacterized protein n=1 Tax=Cladocopium goreaui TaxID=2562237 RepID=A0A9P1DJI8_9DINO|nr:unnamed protein product [Cladocopium goreaui]
MKAEEESAISPSGSSLPPLEDMSYVPRIHADGSQRDPEMQQYQAYQVDQRELNIDQRSIHFQHNIFNPDPSVVGHLAATAATSEVRAEATHAVSAVVTEATSAVAAARAQTSEAVVRAEATQAVAQEAGQDVEGKTLRTKDLHHLKLPPIPESAANYRAWRNAVRTALLAFDRSTEGLLGPWLSRAFTARGAESAELSRDSGDFPRRVIDRYQELPAMRTFDFLWEGVVTALRESQHDTNAQSIRDDLRKGPQPSKKTNPDTKAAVAPKGAEKGKGDKKSTDKAKPDPKAKGQDKQKGKGKGTTSAAAASTATPKAPAAQPKAKAVAAMVAYLCGLGPVMGMTTAVESDFSGYLDFIGDTGAPHRRRANERAHLRDIRDIEEPTAPLERIACDHVISRTSIGIGLYRAWPVDQFKEGVLRERVVRALAIPPATWALADADKDREQFLEDIARHARGGETSLADTAGGEPPKSHEKHEASLAETAGGSKEKHNSKRNRSITLIRIGIHGPTKGCHAFESGGYQHIKDCRDRFNRLIDETEPAEPKKSPPDEPKEFDEPGDDEYEPSIAGDDLEDSKDIMGLINVAKGPSFEVQTRGLERGNEVVAGILIDSLDRGDHNEESLALKLQTASIMNHVPQMPTVKGTIAHEEQGMWLAREVLALVNRPLSREEILRNPKAKEVLMKEANEMRSMKGYESQGQLAGHAASLLMKLLWLSRLSRPDLSFAITSLGFTVTRTLQETLSHARATLAFLLCLTSKVKRHSR